MKKTVALVALNAKYVHSNLAVYDIFEYTKQNLSEKESLDLNLVVREYTINHNLDEILRSIFTLKADIVAFSCYIWNKNEILQIGSELKKILPNTTIILGGPEVSYDSVKLLQKNSFIDGIIVGEGEKPFLELCKQELEQVPNLTYRKKGEIKMNPFIPLMDLDNVPFIYKDLSDFENKILYYESSRGCPFSCSYCLSSIDKTVRFRNLNLVKKELDFFIFNKVRQVKFIDRTFNCDKKRAVEIWKYLKDNDNGVTNFHFEVAADLIDEEALLTISQMRKGLIQLEIGLQTTNKETLVEIRRTMDIESLKAVMLRINSFGNTHQHLDLIAGLPLETLSIFKKSFDDAYYMKPDQLQLGFLKILKGSHMEAMAEEYELKYQDNQPFEVLSTKWIDYEELLELKKVEQVVEIYYNSDQFQHILSYLITSFEGPYEMYKELGCYYEKVNKAGVLLNREAKYKLILDFIEEMKEKGKYIDVQLARKILVFDYYLREKAKSRPDFAGEILISKEQYTEFFKNKGNKELSLNNNDYDSKVAARKMHIETIDEEMKQWISNSVEEKGKYGYAVFDYDNRNPLNKAAKVYIIEKLTL